MSDRKLTPLQQRIGGAFADLDIEALTAAGSEALTHVEVAPLLSGLRNTLNSTLSQELLDVDALYDQAHKVRGIAGTLGCAKLGLIGDSLARYVVACSDANVAVDREVVVVLANAMLSACVKDSDGGEALTALAVSARTLVALKKPPATSGAT